MSHHTDANRLRGLKPLLTGLPPFNIHSVTTTTTTTTTTAAAASVTITTAMVEPLC